MALASFPCQYGTSKQSKQNAYIKTSLGILFFSVEPMNTQKIRKHAGRKYGKMWCKMGVWCSLATNNCMLRKIQLCDKISKLALADASRMFWISQSVIEEEKEISLLCIMLCYELNTKITVLQKKSLIENGNRSLWWLMKDRSIQFYNVQQNLNYPDTGDPQTIRPGNKANTHRIPCAATPRGIIIYTNIPCMLQRAAIP